MDTNCLLNKKKLFALVGTDTLFKMFSKFPLKWQRCYQRSDCSLVREPSVCESNSHLTVFFLLNEFENKFIHKIAKFLYKNLKFELPIQDGIFLSFFLPLRYANRLRSFFKYKIFFYGITKNWNRFISYSIIKRL